ncbi:1-acyl-sn-glycerol-3-phosphate acyltransferase [Actinacidiphila reveromycinica]|uniref:1-acyl-sn-glycerol-3-phosphate acyltransferase n=1 Tax=Actinacidiphila reveromycinica TaxID=659352 RepID=UPI001F0170EA|nr:1-acyl-sn-glycerol-3-phosphate acyltransferase [Streptomyces sp. SN-593]
MATIALVVALVPATAALLVAVTVLGAPVSVATRGPWRQTRVTGFALLYLLADLAGLLVAAALFLRDPSPGPAARRRRQDSAFRALAGLLALLRRAAAHVFRVRVEITPPLPAGRVVPRPAVRSAADADAPTDAPADARGAAVPGQDAPASPAPEGFGREGLRREGLGPEGGEARWAGAPAGDGPPLGAPSGAAGGGGLPPGPVLPGAVAPGGAAPVGAPAEAAAPVGAPPGAVAPVADVADSADLPDGAAPGSAAREGAVPTAGPLGDRPDGSGPDRTGRVPLIVLVRHAGLGDSFLLLQILLTEAGLRPHTVLKRTLRVDPCLDVLLGRVPHCFVPPASGTAVDGIARLAAGLGPGDALVLFPEGGNFTPRRHRRGIEMLRRRGLYRRAARASRLHYVLPPRDGGALAALAAAPTADVVFVTHAGLDVIDSPRTAWSSLPLERVVRAHWWRIPAAEIPRSEEARSDWLLTQWERVDRWTAAHAVAQTPHV